MAEARQSAVRPGGECLTVLVIGAGVSGCACGATIATALGRRGVRVVLMNSALDSVCLPSLGPELCAGEAALERVVECLCRLPAPLRDAWLDASVVVEEGEQVVSVDRRVVSIEGKRALEHIEGLCFRQGLVVDVGARPSAAEAGTGDRAWTFWAETAFGEILEAEILVLAPGLSMGGEVRLGCTTLVGGRYGETPSSGLQEALERLGAEWREVEAEVGPRVGGLIMAAAWEPDGHKGEEPLPAGNAGWAVGLSRLRSVPLRTARGGRLWRQENEDRFSPRVDVDRAAGDSPRKEAERCEAERWPAAYPPCPQWAGVTGQSFWAVRRPWPDSGNADDGPSVIGVDGASRWSDAGRATSATSQSSDAGRGKSRVRLRNGKRVDDVAGVEKSTEASATASGTGGEGAQVIAYPDGLATNEIYVARQEVAVNWLRGEGRQAASYSECAGLQWRTLTLRGECG